MINLILFTKEKIFKASKGVGVIKKFSITLPKKDLLILYMSFFRPLLDYGDIIYGQPNNQNFCNKLEFVQYDATLVITDSIRGTSKIKLCKELGLESLKSRKWFRRLCYFYKIKTFGLPSYLSKVFILKTPGFHSQRMLSHITAELKPSNTLLFL